jgi:hypothetical protein
MCSHIFLQISTKSITKGTCDLCLQKLPNLKDSNRLSGVFIAGEAITNTNNSTNIQKNSKSVLGMPIGTMRRCLMKKTGHKKSRDTVPLTLTRCKVIEQEDCRQVGVNAVVVFLFGLEALFTRGSRAQSSYVMSLNWMAIKKCLAVRLGVIYDSRATNRKKGRLPVRAPLPLPHSNWSPGSHIWFPAIQNTQIHCHKQVEAFTF